MITCIEVRKEFSIAHRLSKSKSKCQNLHGHNYVVKFTVGGKIQSSNDMIMDFDELKGYIKKVHEKYDHTCIVNVQDRVSITGDDTLMYLAYEPTAEVFSVLFAKELIDCMPDSVLDRLRFINCSVSETANNTAITTIQDWDFHVELSELLGR